MSRGSYHYPEVPPALGVYAAALSIALTTHDEYERRGAVWLMREVGAEAIAPVRERRGGHRRGRRVGSYGMADLIRDVLEERLA